MARPQTEEGFVMVALDLFAALMAADLTNREAIVMAEVLLACYGPAKAKSVHLDPAQIEHYTGLHRNNARRAIGELVRANLIAYQEDGSIAPVKDYEAWTPGGKPLADRLGGSLLRFALSAKTRHGKSIKESKKAAIQRDSQDNCKGNPTGLPKQLSDESNGIGPTSDATGGRGEEAHAGAPASEDQKIGDYKTHTEGEWDDYGPPIDPKDADLYRFASHVAAEVFGLKASDGSADPNAARILTCHIRGQDEQAVLYHAARVALRTDINKKLDYFGTICRSGLKPPPAGADIPPGPNGAAPTRHELKQQEIQQGVAARVAKSRGNPS